MTYMHKGKQYIVVPIGARDHPAEFVALGLTANRRPPAASSEAHGSAKASASTDVRLRLRATDSLLYHPGACHAGGAPRPAPLPRPPESGLLTVGETARILGVSPSTLRLWENVGLVSPARSHGRYRLYSPELLDVLKRIKYLRDVKLLNLPGIRQALGKAATAKATNGATPHRSRPQAAAIAKELRPRAWSKQRSARKYRPGSSARSSCRRPTRR